ncbi:nucleotidyltransferase family protein [Kitasatospora sp. NPDC091276]|uniref:nucleotidyltransferase family protein n=1 Tax=unclassified Kitasatospora TaxID=2633591 RepID=UPI0034385D86
MILAAGRGSRMGALTARTPKPLLPLAGKPLLGHLLDRCAETDVTDVYLNLHYQAEQVLRFLDGTTVKVPVHARTEPRLTGPAGALRLFHEELATFDAVLVTSCDVIMGEPLQRLVDAHTRGGYALTFACTRIRQARRYGVLDIDPGGRIRGAREKPDVPDDETHWISAGVYCLDPRVIAHIPEDVVYDYARELAPALMAAGERVGAHRLTGYWRDVGTPDSLREAGEDAGRGLIPWLTERADR